MSYGALEYLRDKILESVTISEILDKYRYETNNRRRIKCFLHGGTHRNLGYNDKVFHCYSCGEAGNVISLVMKIHNLDFKPALIKINYDFGLNYSEEKPSYKDILKTREIAKAREVEKQKQIEDDKLYLKLVKYRQRLWADGRPIEWIDGLLDEPEVIKYLGMELIM